MGYSTLFLCETNAKVWLHSHHWDLFYLFILCLDSSFFFLSGGRREVVAGGSLLISNLTEEDAGL